VFYLDTELQASDFNYIAQRIIESPYSFEKVKQIDRYEVFPVLQLNLLSVAGEWSGFDEEWLIESIVSSINSRNSVRKLAIKGLYVVFKGVNKDYWEELESSYNQLNNGSNS